MSSHQNTNGRLERSLEKLLVKNLHLHGELRKLAGYASFEPTIGGKFPKRQYDEIVSHVRRYVHVGCVCQR
jgi:hypothetical protein